MKLIDLLVQELPKRGGWPEGINFVTQDGPNCNSGVNTVSGWVKSPDVRRSEKGKSYWSALGDNEGYGLVMFKGCLSSDDYDSAIVTREQYEAALKPVWNGQGLPPIGTEFEYGTHRSVAKCIAVSHHHIFASKGDPDDENSDYEEFLIDIGHSSFYPIRTEAECQRDEISKNIAFMLDTCDHRECTALQAAQYVYDAIAAHKITGVTLVPTVSEIVRATEKCSREDAERIVAMLKGE